jgi:hypothetical protein
MQVPPLFRQVLNALNSEQEFNPRAVVAGRLVILPDGRKALRTFKPYWVELRDGAYTFKQTVLLARLRPEAVFKRETVPRLSRAHDVKDLIPPDSVYRRAQEVFVRTLRNLVERWRESDWHLAECFKRHPEMEDQVVELLRHQPLRLLASSSGPSLLINPFVPLGLFGVRYVPRGRDKPVMRARRDAITLFIRLVQHPDHTRLGKCLRCKCYFFGRPGQKCCPRPRRCGSYRAAIEATKRRWRQERAEKLERARAACQEWESLKPRTTRNGWVAKRAGVTQKWLTRAVNRGDLKVPKMTTESKGTKQGVRKQLSH